MRAIQATKKSQLFAVRQKLKRKEMTPKQTPCIISEIVTCLISYIVIWKQIECFFSKLFTFEIFAKSLKSWLGPRIFFRSLNARGELIYKHLIGLFLAMLFRTKHTPLSIEGTAAAKFPLLNFPTHTTWFGILPDLEIQILREVSKKRPYILVKYIM